MDTFINKIQKGGLNYLMLININIRKACAYPNNNLAETIKNGKRGAVDKIMSYDEKKNKYKVQFEGGVSFIQTLIEQLMKQCLNETINETTFDCTTS